jgi:hypothetical protein
MKNKLLMLDRRWMVHHHGRWAPRGTYRFKTARPEKHERPLVVADKPWESMTVNYGSVIYDAGVYRLYYDAIDKDYTADSWAGSRLAALDGGGDRLRTAPGVQYVRTTPTTTP